MWKVRNKKLILENQHHTPIMYLWCALKDNVQKNKDIVDIWKAMFESRISTTRAIEKLPCSEKVRISSVLRYGGSFWSVLKDNVSDDVVDNCRTLANFSGELKNFHTQNFVFLHGLMIWRIMQNNEWNDIVS